MQPARPTLNTHLPDPPRVGEPDVAGPLAVYPLIGPVPALEYLSFAQGAERGVRLSELPGGASVRDLVVENPTSLPVLLFEGEEVLGAQQNRTFDISMLVPAGAKLTVPVSCVEAGRWDGTRHGEAFRPAPQAAYPSLRRMKNVHAAQAVQAGAAARADQAAVWAEVADRGSRHAAPAPTQAMHDVFEHRRRDLDAMTAAIEMRCSQTGMLAWVGDRFAVLDRVSRPEVLESLFAPLVQGYALDALETAKPQTPPSVEEAGAFLERVLAVPVVEHDGLGLGRSIRVAPGAAMSGAGVLVDGEVVQLSVFPPSLATTRAPVSVARRAGASEDRSMEAPVPTKVCPRCGAMATTNDKRCPSCGKPYRRRRVVRALLWISLAGVATIAGCAALIGTAANEAVEELDAKQRAHAITPAQFDALDLGMRQPEVEAELGKEPENRQEFESAGVLDQEPQSSSCIYYNREGGGFGDLYQLCFDDGRLSSKNSY